MSTSLFLISLISLGYLSVYAAVFIFLSVAALFLKKNKNFENKTEDRGDIAVLIPSYQEGEGVVDAVQTVVNQDYKGSVKIYILIENESDNSVEPLDKFYGKARLSSATEEKIQRIFESASRGVYLVFTGLTRKGDKLNYWLKNISAKYVAFLDADHRVSSNWISSSLTKFENDGADAIQARRQPLALNNFIQFWDSAENHIGNEVVNFILNGFKKSVFFTGTTCVFKSEIFKKYAFSDCVAEDTFLSYDLLTGGKKISYNGEAPSYEEVAPDLKNYVNRRRRWSAGHTKNFFAHLRNIFKAPIKLAEKIELLLHGQFYLAPLIAVLLINVYGFYFFTQFTRNIQIFALAAALFISVVLTAVFYKKKDNVFIDWFAAYAWILPQVSILSVYLYKFLNMETYYYILRFPFADKFFYLHLVLLLAPLAAVVSGLILFKRLNNIKNIFLAPTYPFIMFFDIYASFLGFCDFLLGRARWSKVERKNYVASDLVPASVTASISTGKIIKTSYKTIILLLSAVGFIFLANDFLAFDNCGELHKFLWKPLIFKPSSPEVFKINIEKKLSENNSLEVDVKSYLTAKNKSSITYYLDGKKVFDENVSGSEENIAKLNFPLGWEKHELAATAQGDGFICKRTNYFSTALTEIKNNSLYVNGEKFIIKGIIPSFSGARLNLSLDSGLGQLKEIGANTVRFYHSLSESIIAAASKYNLMVIDQPNQSTWDEFDISSSGEKASYVKRYDDMIKKSQGFPYLLFNNLGNEWELGDKSANPIGDVKNLINQIKADSYVWPVSYSTYSTYADYPVDVIGINMLDTGNTYWTKALQALQDFKKPFYASEFGGFTAFWENTPTELRITRFIEYWDDLMNSGAFGAVFFESNDNWAQPVASGYNDPLKPEQPDDMRGFWDEKNKEKLELKFLKEIFSDFDVKILNKTIASGVTEVSVSLNNKRDYSLKNISVNYRDNSLVVGDFKPLETKLLKLAISRGDIQAGKLDLKFEYSSHSGFKNVSINEINLPILSEVPRILNSDFILSQADKGEIKGEMIFSDKIDLVAPDSWQSFYLNGKNIIKTAPRMAIAVENPYHDVLDLRYSGDGISWQKFNSDEIGGGVYYLKFKIPPIVNNKKYLILSGLGTDNITLQAADGEILEISVHNYRENIIDLNLIKKDFLDGEVVLKINRQQIKYIDKNIAGAGLKNDVWINIDPPIIFSSADIEITKGN
ncbi:MAG: Glycosyltransferase group 2 family protein [Parcubacteria group bacterium Athens1014_26]|nr:MAG: Glycosyltransferase group 2 family protein [Parcubacteria group bacterium Athens1014_26]